MEISVIREPRYQERKPRTELKVLCFNQFIDIYRFFRNSYFAIVGPRSVQLGKSYSALLTALSSVGGEIQVSLVEKSSGDEIGWQSSSLNGYIERKITFEVSLT